jgi:hypothetical protein
MTFVFILLRFPSYPDPNPDEMVYAIAVLGFVLMFCDMYYWMPDFGGNTFFTGPVRTIGDVIDENQEMTADIEMKILEDRKSSAEDLGGVRRGFRNPCCCSPRREWTNKGIGLKGTSRLE